MIRNIDQEAEALARRFKLIDHAKMMMDKILFIRPSSMVA